MKRLIVIICILNLFCVRATQSPFDPGSPFGLAATLFRIILTSSESNYRTFITAINYSGNITTADNLCNSDSLKPNVGTYKAVLPSSTRRACSTGYCTGGVSENLDWVFKPNTSYFQSDGSIMVGKTNNSGIFWDGNISTITNSFSNFSNRYWTGLNADFTNSTNNCLNWSSNSSGVSGETGFSVAGDSGISDIPTACNNSNFLLCVEQ